MEERGLWVQRLGLFSLYITWQRLLGLPGRSPGVLEAGTAAVILQTWNVQTLPRPTASPNQTENSSVPYLHFPFFLL